MLSVNPNSGIVKSNATKIPPTTTRREKSVVANPAPTFASAVTKPFEIAKRAVTGTVQTAIGWAKKHQFAIGAITATALTAAAVAAAAFGAKNSVSVPANELNPTLIPASTVDTSRLSGSPVSTPETANQQICDFSSFGKTTNALNAEQTILERFCPIATNTSAFQTKNDVLLKSGIISGLAGLIISGTLCICRAKQMHLFLAKHLF